MQRRRDIEPRELRSVICYVDNLQNLTLSWNILINVQRDAKQSSLFIILQVHCTCFGCQTHTTSGVHKTVTTASGTVQLPPSNVAQLGHVGGR